MHKPDVRADSVRAHRKDRFSDLFCRNLSSKKTGKENDMVVGLGLMTRKVKGLSHQIFGALFCRSSVQNENLTVFTLFSSPSYLSVLGEILSIGEGNTVLISFGSLKSYWRNADKSAET